MVIDRGNGRSEEGRGSEMKRGEEALRLSFEYGNYVSFFCHLLWNCQVFFFFPVR